ncbi:MAG: hypothetical protein HYV42_05585 [Candidatus Magasanikbacteria bacterium]|nr:hypothetical protein [Candidatus Magasanikbacteria bacterium]
MTQTTKTVALPRPLFRSLFSIAAQWDDLTDQLEDYLLAADKTFLKRMTRARQEHLQGKLHSWENLKHRLAR